jgi:hypothetical protein
VASGIRKAFGQLGFHLASQDLGFLKGQDAESHRYVQNVSKLTLERVERVEIVGERVGHV